MKREGIGGRLGGRKRRVDVVGGKIKLLSSDFLSYASCCHCHCGVLGFHFSVYVIFSSIAVLGGRGGLRVTALRWIHLADGK
jgi:hypothetical protein